MRPLRPLAGLSLLALAGLLSPATGQPGASIPAGKGQIVGRVTTDGAAAVAGRVRIMPSGPIAAADGNGAFSLLADPGTFSVRCEASGAQPRTYPNIKVSAGAATALNCVLKGVPATPPAVVAAAEPARDKVAPATKAPARAEAGEARGVITGTIGVGKGGGGTGVGTIGVGRVGTRGHGSGSSTGNYGRGAMPIGVRRPRPSRPMAIGMKMAGPRPDADADREGYEAVTENDYKSAVTAPLSTFSVDVDTASYANVRGMLNQGRVPPAASVRIEEFLNYFPYDYAEPKGEHPFSVYTEYAVAPYNPERRLVHIGLQAKRVENAKLPASNLVFLVDVSGSMNAPDKLPLLKQAFKLLAAQLRPQDRVSLAVYAGAAGVVLPPTDGADQSKIIAALDSLSAGGSTAGGAGIQLAYSLARQGFVQGGNNRVILATDGDFNVGVSSDGELVKLIEEERKSGVFLTILGFGRGNYQDAKMQQLAQKGNGNAAYIDSVNEARKVLVTQMGGTLLTVAKDVKIQVEFNPAHVKGYRLVGYETRALANEDFNNDKKDAGEMGAGHSVTALYEIIPADSKEVVPGVDALKYQKPAPSAAADSNELLTVKLRYKQPDGDTSKLLSQVVLDAPKAFAEASETFRFSAAVATFAMLMQGSKHVGNTTFGQVQAWADSARGKDFGGYRAEMIGLVQRAAALKWPTPPPGTALQLAH